VAVFPNLKNKNNWRIPNLSSRKLTAAVDAHFLISSFRRHAEAVNVVSSTLVASQSSSKEHPTHRCYWITIRPFLCCSPFVAAVVKLLFCCSPFVAAVANLQLALALVDAETSVGFYIDRIRTLFAIGSLLATLRKLMAAYHCLK